MGLLAPPTLQHPAELSCLCFPLLLGQEYKLLFEGAGSNPGDKTLEDRFFEHEVSIGLFQVLPGIGRGWWLKPVSGHGHLYTTPAFVHR